MRVQTVEISAISLFYEGFCHDSVFLNDYIFSNRLIQLIVAEGY